MKKKQRKRRQSQQHVDDQQQAEPSPLAEGGGNPFVLESKAPDGSLQTFLSGETRYATLERSFPEESGKLRAQIEGEVNQQYDRLKLLADPKSICETGEDA